MVIPLLLLAEITSIFPRVHLQLAKPRFIWTCEESEMNSNLSKTSLHLLQLPYELRHKIWVYTLGGNTFEIQCWPSDGPLSIATQITIREEHQCSLLADLNDEIPQAREACKRQNIGNFC